MAGTLYNVRRLMRAEGALPQRRNASPASSLRGRTSEQVLQFSEARRNFASAATEFALVAAFKHAFDTRKKEEGLSQARLGRRCGRWAAAVGRTLQGWDWRLSTLSDFAEALDLRLEFAFVDRKHPTRRFTAYGVEYAPIDPDELILGG